MTDRIIEAKGVVVRHGIVELLEHWLLGLSGIVLIVSGLFQMPMPRRYYIIDIPGMAWSGDFMVTLQIHYIAAVVFIAVCLFHVVYHGMLGHTTMLPKRGDVKESIDVIKTFFGKGEEPPFHKFLPEQRIAYLGMAVIIAVLILSGIVKTYKNVFDPQMSFLWVSWATWLHNIFTALFILAFIAHIAAILLKPNLPMLRGIFYGSVRLDYAERRHPLWIAEIRGAKQPEPAPEEPLEEAEVTEAAGDVPEKAAPAGEGDTEPAESAVDLPEETPVDEGKRDATVPPPEETENKGK